MKPHLKMIPIKKTIIKCNMKNNLLQLNFYVGTKFCPFMKFCVKNIFLKIIIYR